MTRDPRRLADVLEALFEDSSSLSAVADVAGAGRHADSARLLFLGNPQDPCPRLLLLDPRLEPVDIVTWQVIRIHSEPGKAVAFPSYPDLMRWVRVSRATIARAVSLLRLSRWLLLCGSRRAAEGRFLGNVYGLIDESLPLPEMLELDAGYIAFAEHARAHRSVHVRRVAGQVLEEAKRLAELDAPSALAPVPLAGHLEQRFDRIRALMEASVSIPASSDTRASLIRRARDERHAEISGEGVQNLNADRTSRGRRVQDLNADRVQNASSLACSSSGKKETTTTEEGGKFLNAVAPCEFSDQLKLTDSQRRVLAMRLAGLPIGARQEILDEGTARILAKRRSADPVRSEFDYLARLCSLALAGEFVMTDAGTQLRDRRVQRARAERELERARERSEQRRLEELAEHRARRQDI